MIHLSLYIGDHFNDDIKILLGADVIGLILTGTVVKIYNKLVAVRTHLGWTVFEQQTPTKQTPFMVGLLTNTLDTSE